VHLVVPRGRYADMKAAAVLDEPIRAPLAAGQQVGMLAITLDGQTYAEVPLRALAAVPQGSVFSRLYDEVLLWLE